MMMRRHIFIKIRRSGYEYSVAPKRSIADRTSFLVQVKSRLSDKHSLIAIFLLIIIQIISAQSTLHAQCDGYAIAVTSQSGITNASYALGAANGNGAELWDANSPTICDEAMVTIAVADHSAGEDKTVCVNGLARMSGIGSGIWTANPLNPATVQILNPYDPHTNITGFTVAGTYSFSWVLNGLTDEANVTVYNYPTLSLSNTPSFPVCSGVPFVINCTTNDTSATWNCNFLDTSGASFPINISSGITNNGTGLMNVTFMATAESNGGSCQSSQTIIAEISPAPGLLINPLKQNVCSWDSVNITATPIQPGTTIDWSAVNNTTLITYSGSGNVNQVFPAGNYTFTFTGSYNSCLSSTTATVVINN
ncbi:MAG: hypothetical protein U9R19_17835 [Bacteroidota bacterium]|nr:hypothetical protein [Bacteroidota bacterium]